MANGKKTATKRTMVQIRLDKALWLKTKAAAALADKTLQEYVEAVLMAGAEP